VSIFATARAIYLSLKDDPSAIEKIQQAASELAVAIATDPNGAGTITSATMNGQTFAMINALTPRDRLAVLRIVLTSFDAGMTPQRTAQPLFISTNIYPTYNAS